jgi:hypothetical protein
MVDGPAGPGFDVVSTMLSLILIGSVAYIVVSLAQRGAPPPAEPTDASNPVLRTMYTLALGVLVAAFVGFGIEVVYPAPEFPERELFDGPGEPPPEEMIVEETVSPQESEEKAKEPPPKDLPPQSGLGFQEYERELAEHNRIGSVIALGASVLILVAALIPVVGLLPVIGGGLMLGGVLTLLYGVILAIQAQSPLLRFLAVTVGLIVLLVALYLKFRPSRTTAP